MFVRLLFACSLSLTFVGSGYGAPAGGIRIGAWSGGPVHTGPTKQFEYCSASAANGQGIVISYSVDRQYRWRLGFSSPGWNFSPGYSLNLRLRLGEKGTSVQARATVDSNQVLEVQTDDDLALFAALWSASKLFVTAGGLQFDFELISSNEILDTLLRCVMRQVNPARRPSQTPALSLRVDPVIVREARELLGEILAFGRVRDAQIVSAGGNSAVAWRTNLITSSLAVIEGSIPKSSDIPFRIFDRDIRQCRNEAFFAWSVVEIDRMEIARAMTICAALDATIFSRYIATRRAKGGYYLMTSTVTGGGFGGVIQAQLEEADARLRAAFVPAVQRLDRDGAQVPVPSGPEQHQVDKPEEAAPFARE